MADLDVFIGTQLWISSDLVLLTFRINFCKRNKLTLQSNGLTKWVTKMKLILLSLGVA